MTLFSRLFPKAPPPPPPPTSAERVTALQSAPADLVVNTALGDDDATLRVGAIRLLPDGDALRVAWPALWIRRRPRRTHAVRGAASRT